MNKVNFLIKTLLTVSQNQSKTNTNTAFTYWKLSAHIHKRITRVFRQSNNKVESTTLNINFRRWNMITINTLQVYCNIENILRDKKRLKTFAHVFHRLKSTSKQNRLARRVLNHLMYSNSKSTLSKFFMKWNLAKEKLKMTESVKINYSHWNFCLPNIYYSIWRKSFEISPLIFKTTFNLYCHRCTFISEWLHYKKIYTIIYL